MIWSRRELLERSVVAAPLLSMECMSRSQALVEKSGVKSSLAAQEQWYWFPGHAFCMKSTGKETGGTCTWMLVENTPRLGVPFHKHLHEDESFYVEEGLFEITVGDVTVTGGPGMYVFGPRTVPHRWTNVGSGRGRLLNVFTPSGLEEYFLSTGIPVKRSTDEPPVDMAALSAKMARLREKLGLIRTGTWKYPPPAGHGTM